MLPVCIYRCYLYLIGGTAPNRNELKVKLVATDTKIQIKWFAVDTNGNKFRNNKGFISSGWDATCSCGWETKTGGGIKAWVISEVEAHKVIAHNYTWKVGA